MTRVGPEDRASNPPALSDAKIVESWRRNAAPWTVAVRDGQIESRKLITNDAIIAAVLSRAPRTALDIGCGEGWLTHRLADLGVDVLGTDVVPELIEQARVAGRGKFEIASYEEMAQGKITGGFDVAVCNFALLGNESVNGLFRAIPRLLNPGGVFIVQTIHPVIGCGDQPYVDGWRHGSWAGFSTDFTDPAPWYFRTIETWVNLFTENGFSLKEIREPLNPNTQKAASVIFIGEKPG
jgi:2-polyprenyl-3-methyl-5-hydroxy-6-metoxy-1,4-benzoquinol methylase